MPCHKAGTTSSILSKNLCPAGYVHVLHSPSILFYLVNLQHFSCKQVVSSRLENNVDPDQVASLEASIMKPADLD